LALKAKHEVEKFSFERKIKDLQQKLKERSESMEAAKSREQNSSSAIQQ